MVRMITSILAAVLALLATSDLRAQQASSVAQQVVGTWAVVSQYVEQEDKRVQPFGEKPMGRAMYDDKGRFMLILHRADLPKFASNNRMTGTADEYKSIGQGSIAYYGTYTIDDKEGTITQRYEGSTYPNWQGEAQKRLITLSGDELRIISPFTSVGGGKAFLVLSRMK